MAMKLAEPAWKAIQASGANLDPELEMLLDKSSRVFVPYKDLAKTHGLEALAVSYWTSSQIDYHFAV